MAEQLNQDRFGSSYLQRFPLKSVGGMWSNFPTQRSPKAACHHIPRLFAHLLLSLIRNGLAHHPDPITGDADLQSNQPYQSCLR